MSRITMSLENDFEGRVLASFDLDEYANKVRVDAIDEFIRDVLCELNRITEDESYSFNKDNANLVLSVMYGKMYWKLRKLKEQGK